MNLEKLKEEFDHVKKKYEVVSKKQEVIYIPRRDYDFFVDALDYLLDQKLIQMPKKEKEKEKKPSK